MYGFNNASSYSKNITQHLKKSPVEYKEIEIIGTRPSISRNFPPIGRNIEFAQSQCLSDRETGDNFQSCSVLNSTNYYCVQHDTLYYQPQSLANYNQLQQYCHHRTTQRAPYRTDYDK